jgi:integrase/recombinase XerC
MSRLSVEVAPLAAAVVEQLAGLPNGDTVLPLRQRLLAGDPRFAGLMRRQEASGLPPRMLAELWLWLTHLVLDMGSRPETTGQTYGRTVGRFLGWCAANGIDHATAKPADFERWSRWLRIERGNSVNWLAKQIPAVQNFYSWRHTRGLAERHIAADLRSPRVKERPPRKYTVDQLRSLFRAIDQGPAVRQKRDRAAVLMLLSTGLRREELARLSLHDLELGPRRGVVRVDGKGAKQRDVPFEGPVVDLIREWLAEREGFGFDFDRDALWISLSGRTRGERMSLRSHDQLLAFHAKAAKLRDWGLHRFRVTFATQLYDDGADIETIRTLMGHESIETTRRYLAVSEKARRTRLSANRQHTVLGSKPTGTPLWARLASGELSRD